MSNDLENNNDAPKGMSIFDIWRILRSYLWELVKFSWLIVGLAVFLGWYLYNRKLKDPVRYKAEVSFMLNKESTASKQSVLRLFNDASVSGGGGSNEINLNRLQELLITRKVSELALFSKAKLNVDDKPKNDYLINHYLRIFGPNYTFEHDSVTTFTRKQNKILLSVHNRIIRSHLFSKTSPSGIIRITFNSVSEEFSKEYVTNLYYQLDTFYYNKAIEKEKLILKTAEERKTQLAGKLRAAQLDFTQHKDQHSFYTKSDVGLKNEEYQYRLEKATTEYLSALNSFEAARVSLEQQAPIMQAIDMPIYPLPASRPNAFLHLLVGVAAGGFLGVFVVVAQKFVRDFLRNERLKQQHKQEESSNPET